MLLVCKANGKVFLFSRTWADVERCRKTLKWSEVLHVLHCIYCIVSAHSAPYVPQTQRPAQQKWCVCVQDSLQPSSSPYRFRSSATRHINLRQSWSKNLSDCCCPMLDVCALNARRHGLAWLFFFQLLAVQQQALASTFKFDSSRFGIFQSCHVLPVVSCFFSRLRSCSFNDKRGQVSTCFKEAKDGKSKKHFRSSFCKVWNRNQIFHPC